MKSLILYESKHGATKTSAIYINERIPNSQLTRASEFTGSLEEYDQIIIASCVYVGQFHKHIKQFLLDHESELLSTSLTIVVCAMNEAEFDSMIEQNLSIQLIEHATIVHAGGAYDFNSMNFLERFVVKKIAKVKTSIDQIKYDSLDTIIKTVNQ